MPTVEQIRAARAFLGWNQDALAEHSGLSQTGIARIENGTNHPNAASTKKIIKAFDKFDVEFIGENGVKKRTNEVRTLQGTQGFREFMDDVYEVAKTQGGELCIFNGRPILFKKFLGEEWYAHHANRMKKIKEKFNFKIIVEEGNNVLIATDFAEYRWFPKQMFNEQTIYVYGSKLAFLTFKEDDMHIKILDQKVFADSLRILFNIAWNNVATISEEKI